jgi:hypothetical protein
VNVRSCVGYQVCFRTRGVVLCKSRDVKIVQDAASVFITGGNDNGGVRVKKGYIYSNSGDFLVQGSTCEFGWLMNTTRRSLHLAAPFILLPHRAPYERQASRRELILAVRIPWHAGCCFGLSYHFYRPHHMHVGAN